MTEKNKVILFCGLVLLIAVVVSFFKFPALLAAYMFIPALVTLIMLFLVTKDGLKKESWKQIGLGINLKFLIYAFFIPFVVLILSYFIATKINSGYFLGLPDGKELKPINSLFFILMMAALQTITVSLGEELGWRGYLLPKLLNLTSNKLSAYLITGMVWAIWHFPVIFIAKSYNTEGNLFYTTSLFVVVVLVVSIIIGELKMKSKSIWTASLFHSAHNTVWGFLTPLFVTTGPIIYLTGESGFITIALYSLVAFLLLWINKGKTYTPA